MMVVFQVFADEPSKAAWLSGKLPEFIDAGDVVLFVGQRARVEDLVARLTAQGVRAGGIHGDMDQVGGTDRMAHQNMSFVHKGYNLKAWHVILPSWLSDSLRCGPMVAA